MSNKDSPDKEDFREAIKNLEPYVRHRKNCAFNQSGPKGDFCTCGVGDVIDEVDSLMRET